MDIAVRMYRQGLGDCFLIRFTEGGKTAHMMIDCGVLTGTAEGEKKINAAVDNILQVTGGAIDVLVVTHEHFDHVSGFVQAQAKLDPVPIGEIWLAWTEDDTHGLAYELREKREKAKRAVRAAHEKLKQSTSLAARQSERMVEVLSLFDGGMGVAGRKTKADAMRWVRDHERAKISCLRPGGAAVTSALLPGIRVYVLGPPENLKQIRKSRPGKKDPEVYSLAEGLNLGLLAALNPDTTSAARTAPFDSSFRRSVEDAKKAPFFGSYYFGAAEAWRQIEDDWLGSSERLALQLDSDTNNTSLVLAIEDIATGRIMLFPGDAQVGNWLSWQDHTWTFTRPDGTEGSRTLDEILARTVLYKVGHHASHNATLAEKGLELMTHPDLAALIPVDAAKAQTLDWQMPFGPLLARLIEKTRGRVIRSDIGALPKPDNVPAPVWADFQSRITPDKTFLQYRLP